MNTDWNISFIFHSVLRHNIHGRFVGISGKYSRVFSVLRLNYHFILGWVWGGAKVFKFFAFSRYAEKNLWKMQKSTEDLQTKQIQNFKFLYILKLNLLVWCPRKSLIYVHIFISYVTVNIAIYFQVWSSRDRSTFWPRVTRVH